MNLFNVVVCGRYKIPLRCQLLNDTSSLTSACGTSSLLLYLPWYRNSFCFAAAFPNSLPTCTGY